MIKSNIKAIFRPLKLLYSRILRHDKIYGRIDQLSHEKDSFIEKLTLKQTHFDFLLAQIGCNPSIARYSFPIPPWYDQNLCEPTVQIVLRDLCRPGDTVFDVGANAGALSLLMSRLVGLKGRVVSFEASRRIVDKTQHNLTLNGCSNVELYNRAIYHTSGQTAVIYHGSHLNDSLLASNDAGVGKSEVETLSIDDFVAYTGHVPKLIKMDIEGAEFDALRGAKQLIAATHPTFLLEQQPEDMRCIDLLRTAGYITIDLATYRVVYSPSDFPAGSEIANVLCIHQSKIHQTPYMPPFQMTTVTELLGADFQFNAEGSRELSLKLGAGRYIFDFDFSASGTDNEVMMGVECGPKTLIRYHAFSKLLAVNYRQIPLDIKKDSTLNVFFRFVRGTNDPSLDFRRVTVTRIENFNGLAGPLVD